MKLHQRRTHLLNLSNREPVSSTTNENQTYFKRVQLQVKAIKLQVSFIHEEFETSFNVHTR